MTWVGDREVRVLQGTPTVVDWQVDLWECSWVLGGHGRSDGGSGKKRTAGNATPASQKPPLLGRGVASQPDSNGVEKMFLEKKGSI